MVVTVTSLANANPNGWFTGVCNTNIPEKICSESKVSANWFSDDILVSEYEMERLLLKLI